MLKKDITKRIAAVLAAAMVASCGMASYAEEATEPEQGVTDTTPETPETDPPAEEESITQDVNISANYVEDTENNTYTVVFTTLTELEELKNFDFKISVSDGTIKSADFSEALSCDNAIVAKGNTQATFTDGAETTPVSGKVVLCTVVLNKGTAAPTSETLTISDFTAVNSEDKSVTITPNLTVTDEPIIPKLTDEEQNAYDLVAALPKADTLSFYTDEDDTKLADLDELSETIKTAVDAYKALSADEKKNVDDTLAYYNKTAEGIEELNTLAADMVKVSDVMNIALTLNDVEDEDLLSYKFLPNIYNNVVAAEITESELSFAEESALKTEYEKAKTDIAAKKTSIDEKYDALGTDDVGYDKKVKLLSTQLEVVQSKAGDKYYSDYLEDLVEQAEALKEDLEDYPVEATKEAFIEDIDDCVNKIEVIQTGAASFPEIKFPNRINRKHNNTIEFTRTKKAAVDATVTVVVYAENDLETEIDRETAEFEEGKTVLEVKLSASGSKYPGDENVVIYVYYEVEGAEFLVDTKTLFCKNVATTGITGITSGGGSSSSSGGSSSSSGGTKFPTPSEDEEDDNNKREETVIFEDIEGLDWAKEAIEGLYYMGIVNGMEEGVFNPAGNVTREQFCKMVVQLFEVLENETESNFVDVDPDAWYAPYIVSAIRAGYVQGQSDEYFGIGESIMRQDMATILYRALGDQNTKQVLEFTDKDDIASYAEEAISTFVGLGVLNGYEDGTFKPRGTATRAEAAKVIWEVYNIMDEQ